MTSKHIATPLLLAVDASENISSVALQYFDKTHSEVQIDSIRITDTKLQAAILLPSIDKLLKSKNLALKDIDAFVLANGPGRFTGLRIATSLIQSLAYSCNKKIITLNSLQLLAEQYVTAKKEAKANHKAKIWVCQKSYNNHYYQAKFISHYSTISFEQQIDYIKTKQDFEQELKNGEQYEFVGAGWLEIFDRASTEFKNIYSESPDIKYCFEQANIEYSKGNLLNAFEVQPVYGVNPYQAKY